MRVASSLPSVHPLPQEPVNTMPRGLKGMDKHRGGGGPLPSMA